MARTQLALGLTFLLACTGYAEDWPQLLGPSHNGTWCGPVIRSDWDARPPKTLWRKKTGLGYSCPVIAGGKVILFHRIGAEEIVECLDRDAGNTLWKFSYPTKFRDGTHIDDGPRATPAIDGDRVYSYGAEGWLHCLDLATGKKIWGFDAKTKFKAERRWHGMISSPIIEGNALLLNVGSTNAAGIVAFNKSDGSTLWTSTSDKFTGSTPVCANIDGKRCAVFVTPGFLVGVDPANGKEQFRTRWGTTAFSAVIASSPVIVSNNIFVSAFYGVGGTLFKIDHGSATKIWSSSEFSTHYQTAIYKDGYLYASDGHQSEQSTLRCVELATGKVQWSNEELGASNQMLVNDDLLLLTQRGELILASVNPKALKIKARTQILSHLVRAYPALSDGFLVGRSQGEMVCVDLR
ncbi:MAG: PQQ-binding-like beta-propeller repeat protein [Limisphaerales bacterium]